MTTDERITCIAEDLRLSPVQAAKLRGHLTPLLRHREAGGSPDKLIRKAAEDMCGYIALDFGANPIDDMEVILRARLAPLLAKAAALDKMAAIGMKQAVRLENQLPSEWRFVAWGFYDQHGRIAKREWYRADPAAAIQAAEAADGTK